MAYERKSTVHAHELLEYYVHDICTQKINNFWNVENIKHFNSFFRLECMYIKIYSIKILKRSEKINVFF